MTEASSISSNDHRARGAGSVVPAAGYSRTGDDGATTLGDLSRTAKGESRIVAYGTCEEANAAIGMAIALASGLPEPVVITLTSVQNDLVDVAADLCSPTDGPGPDSLRIDDGYIERLERACDHFDDELPSHRSFVVPGGTGGAALLHNARAAVRRAERAAWTALSEHTSTVNPATGRYLNRLSALLFILARGENIEHGEVSWRPGLSALSEDGELWTVPVFGPTE